MSKKLEQIRTEAESGSNYLNDKNYTKIYVSASVEHPASHEVLKRFQQDIDKHKIKAAVITSGSSGLYDLEPIVTIMKPEKPAVLYTNITPETASELVNNYLLNDNSRPDLALCTTGNGKLDGIHDSKDIPLFGLQNRIALRNCGVIDPENVNEYILRGNGYNGLSKAISMKQTDVIRELDESGLRGREDAGGLIAEKWRTCSESEEREKYIICNAIDSDPGACAARLLLESDPHSVLEGMLITGYAIGAANGIICVNPDHTVAIARLEKALEQMRGYDLLGENILDSGFACDIEIKKVSPSLVSDEETALISFLEGRQLIPSLNTPYRPTGRMNEKPAVVNHIETFSQVSAIFHNGAAWFADIGTELSKGTKIITITGDVIHSSTVEVPFGTSLKTLIDEIGGGVADGKHLKAVQFGGPTGCYFTADSLDVPVSYEKMQEIRCPVGSGTVRVFNSDSCTVEMTRDVMVYLQAQSCGKCVFCREGTYQILDILNDISGNKGKPEDIDQLLELAAAMKTGSICDLGKYASVPVESSIRLFSSDFDAHIKEKHCPQNNNG